MKMLKLCCKASINFALSVIVFCGSGLALQACEFPKGWFEMTSQTQGSSRVAIAPILSPVAIGQPFDFEFSVCMDDSQKIERLNIDATMPAHKHGMNYEPYVTKLEAEETYQANGMFFHMPGQWQITIDVYGVSSSEQFSLDIDAK